MWCKNFSYTFFRYVTKQACDRQTDKQTDGRTDGQNYDPQGRANIAASRSKNEQLHDVCYNSAYDAFVTFLFNACSAHIIP